MGLMASGERKANLCLLERNRCYPQTLILNYSIVLYKDVSLKYKMLSLAITVSLAGPIHASELPMLLDRPADSIPLDRSIETKLKQAGGSPSIIAKAVALSAANININADAENAEINCKPYPRDKYSQTLVQDCTTVPVDLSKTVADVIFFYHPRWMEQMPSKGQAFKAIREEIATTNRVFAQNTPAQLKLVAFEEPTFAGYRDFEVALYGGEEKYQELLAVGLDEVPNSFDAYNNRSSSYTYQGEKWTKYYYGAEGMLNLSWNYLPFYLSGRMGIETLPEDTKMLLDYSPDIEIYGRLAEPEYSDFEKTLCGSAGFNAAQLTSHGVNTCPNTVVHEIGHVYLADHDLAHRNTDNIAKFKRATDSPCDGGYTVMTWQSSPDTKLYYSSPEVIVNGSVCGDESTMNNAKQISLAAPFVANIMDEMDVIGDVWLGDTPVIVSESDESLSFVVSRNGDLSKSASVKVFIDNAVTLLDSDFIDVKFAAGESTKSVVVSIIDNASTAENSSLVAELVTPRLLKVTGSTMAITINNDDVLPVVTPPTTSTTPTTPTTPEPESSSGGGSLGYISLVFLALARRLRK
ncbi:hypothetical protein B4O99_02990 [Shewanella xiamenensis]|nr:hypothetical protein [Shewanella xiamenensis]